MQIIVLGMHRSGTSAITRLINMMGAYFAPKNLWLEANPDNPKGFWERKDVLALNRAILHENGCAWHRVEAWDDLRLSLSPHIKRAMQSTLAELNQHRPWVIKDPRLCITLPVWLSHLNMPLAVIVSRHPLEIAQSLQLRNGMPPEYGLALWEYHAVNLIRHAAHLPKIFTDYEALLASPLESTARLHNHLRQYAPTLSLPADDAIAAFITPSLRRAHAEGDLNPHHAMLYAMLCGTEPFDPAIAVSEESGRIMRTLGGTVSGAPVNR